MQFRSSILRKLGVLLSTILLVVASFALSASPAAAAEYTVKMGTDKGQLLFVPEKLTVSPGDTITWEMNKLGPHNVIFGKKAPDGLTQKKLIRKKGDTLVSTVPSDAVAGNYDFYCQPHRSAGMKGKLTIQ
ncbi:MAG: plastocyanin [Symploca sp. SIO2D2]|nr:plastocyanin [Symploca sp. SIO2D2]